MSFIVKQPSKLYFTECYRYYPVTSVVSRLNLLELVVFQRK